MVVLRTGKHLVGCYPAATFVLGDHSSLWRPSQHCAIPCAGVGAQLRHHSSCSRVLRRNDVQDDVGWLRRSGLRGQNQLLVYQVYQTVLLQYTLCWSSMLRIIFFHKFVAFLSLWCDVFGLFGVKYIFMFSPRQTENKHAVRY